MALFESKFKNSLKTSVPLLDKIMHYIIKRKGKQMRPLFVFLTAKLFNNVNESTYTAASLIELLHTATLVHDDIIDEDKDKKETSIRLLQSLEAGRTCPPAFRRFRGTWALLFLDRRLYHLLVEQYLVLD